MANCERTIYPEQLLSYAVSKRLSLSEGKLKLFIEVRT